jgi:hypothetical protein
MDCILQVYRYPSKPHNDQGGVVSEPWQQMSFQYRQIALTSWQLNDDVNRLLHPVYRELQRPGASPKRETS